MRRGPQGIEADRMVTRFANETLGTHEPSLRPQAATYLVAAAASQLGVSDRALHYRVWDFKRGQS